MCTGGDPGGGSEENKTTAETPTKLEDRPKAKPKAKKTVATVKPKKGSKPGDKDRYTIKGGTIKTPDRFEQLKPATGGLSPGAVRAITGSDKAAANMAGRADISKEQLGDLQTRAKGGKSSLPGAAGAVLGGIGQASAARLLKSLTEDTPTIAKLGDKPVYSVTPVVNPRTGQIVGVKEPGAIKGTTVYSGQPAFDPISPKDTSTREKKTKAPAIEEEIVEVAQMGNTSTRSTKARRGSGRRTAFGTRRSLVNLRNV